MEINNLEMKSANIINNNIEKILKLFPECVVEDNKKYKIDFDKLRQEFSEVILDNKKYRYQLTWSGMNEAYQKANTQTTNTLRPIRNKSEKFEKTQNLYIEGDNLEVLKILQESYLNSIKCIYIDPPYNTGNDFIYNDNFFKDNLEELIDSGVVDQDGNILTTNEKNNLSNGRFHSDWLTMMYPRLKLARNLLKEDGVIFISIDDNEVTNLKKLCESIFGERNVETLIWNKEASGSSGTLKQISTTRRIHEYIICAFKNYSNVTFNKIHEALKGRENEFQTANLAVNADKENKNHPNYFTIKNPSGEEFTRQWKWSKKEIDDLIKQDLIFWGTDGHKQPRLIIPTDERRTTYLLSILNYGGTTVGRKDFEDIMGTEIEFSYPKPVILLEKLFLTATNENDIILDFFSGSATTAQAVLNISKNDKKRKFILVQLPELYEENTNAYKQGYKTICDVGEERIRRVAKKIGEEKPDIDVDLGFRVFKVDSSNMKDVYYEPSKLKQTQLNIFESNIKDERTAEDLLTQVILNLGLTLDLNIKAEKIIDNTVYFVAENSLVACFDNQVNIDILNTICEIKPLKIVFRESSFKNDSEKINAYERIKKLSPETEISVI